jgi:hypothetical protein
VTLRVRAQLDAPVGTVRYGRIPVPEEGDGGREEAEEDGGQRHGHVHGRPPPVVLSERS